MDEEIEVVAEEVVMMYMKVMIQRKKKKKSMKDPSHNQTEDSEEIGVEEAEASEVTVVEEEAVTITRMTSSSVSLRHARTIKDKKQLTTKAANLRTSDMCTRPDLPSQKLFDA